MTRRIELWAHDSDTLLAEGLVTRDGAACLRTISPLGWVLYSDLKELRITTSGVPDAARVYTVGDVATRAYSNALQDRCENIPYGSVVRGIAAGGPAPPRETWQAPEWIAPSERDLYLQEYARAIAEILGVRP